MPKPHGLPAATARPPSTLGIAPPPLTSDLRLDLSGAPDLDSLCATIRAHLRPYGTVARIELLPSQWLGHPAIVCIIDLDTPVQTQAAQAGLGLSRFGTRSLTVVVRAPSFSLGLGWAVDFRP